MGYSRKDIYDTSPLALKNVNDNFKYLWFKTFGNLTDADMSASANIDGKKIKDGSISADKIEANSITANEIDVSTLYVGTGGIAMSPTATISWSQVSSKPFIPDDYTDAEALAAWRNSGYGTYIGSNGIYTGTLLANQITAGIITGDMIRGGTIIGTNMDTRDGAGHGVYMQGDNIKFWDNGAPRMAFAMGTTYNYLFMCCYPYANGITIKANNNNTYEIDCQGNPLNIGASLTVNNNAVLTTVSTITAKFA